MPNDISRFVGVTLEAIRRFVPPNVKLSVVPEAPDFPLCGTDRINFHSPSVDGFFYQPEKPRTMVIPVPTTPLCMFIALHEVGHIAVGSLSRWTNTREDERNASRWAKAWMEAHDLPVPPEVWAQATTQWMEREPMAARHGRRFLNRQKTRPHLPFLLTDL